ncbi:MAG TPA: hypothetical protein VJ718_03315 [Candidatus Binataceae bacterium]|nr:hypothetical protein [Candidatus Binataceae bacterium]
MAEAHKVEIRNRDQLAAPIRDRSGKVRFRESLEIIREVDNLGRRMLLARFEDGATVLLFPHELVGGAPAGV